MPMMTSRANGPDPECPPECPSAICLLAAIFTLPKMGKRDKRRKVPLSARSEEHTSELQSLMRISYAVFCLKKKKKRPRISKTETTSKPENSSSKTKTTTKY